MSWNVWAPGMGCDKWRQFPFRKFGKSHWRGKHFGRYPCFRNRCLSVTHKMSSCRLWSLENVRSTATTQILTGTLSLRKEPCTSSFRGPLLSVGWSCTFNKQTFLADGHSTTFSTTGNSDVSYLSAAVALGELYSSSILIAKITGNFNLWTLWK